jgi:2-hydroxyacyl-CoA lyase 1
MAEAKTIDGGRLAARQLKAAGIDTVFGVVAGPMIQVFAGAQAEGLRVIGCRHEENAAFMASAWGWLTRKPGVVIVGSGPGMTNAVTPLYVATESGMPLVVLGGSAYGNTRGIGAFQEANQVAFAAPGCKWTGQVDSAERIGEWVYVALGRALAGRPGGVYLDFPGETVAREMPEAQARIRKLPAEIARPHPDPAAIQRIADMLATASRPLVIVGKGAAWADAGTALRGLVDLGFPYVTSPMGRGVVPDDHANFVNAARSHALRGADAILVVGARMNWIFGFGHAPRYREGVRIAQIDVSPEEFSGGAEIEIGVVADAAVATQALCEALAGRRLAVSGGPWLGELRAAREKNEATLRAVIESDAVPINPYRLVRELRDTLPRETTISVDGETIMGICRTLLPSFSARSRLNAGTTGCMGTGVPYAIGAALAWPDRPSVAVLGDYAFGTAMQDVETAVRIGAKVVFVVSNNEGIAGHMLQDHFLPPGSPRIASLLPAHYEKVAEMVDGHAERVEEPDAIRPALERALASDRVAVVHVRVDPKAYRLAGSNYLQ